MLKKALLDFAINEKCCSVDGAFALFFRPHPGGFDSSRVPIPGEFAIQGQEHANARGQPEEGGGGRAQLELTDA